MNMNTPLQLNHFLERFRSPYISYVITLFSVLFSLSILWNAWGLWQGRQIMTETPMVSPIPVPAVSLANLHLFGDYNTELVNLPATHLPLVLQGTMVSSQLGSSRALIQVTGLPTKVLQVGQTIIFGVTLKEVERDRVIISNQGNLESLSLPRLQGN